MARPAHRLSARLGAATLALWALAALLAPALLPWSRIDLHHVLAPPSLAHWCGTDALGRDVLARTLAGARPILTIAPAATLVAVALGGAAGMAAGYFGDAIDAVLGRLIDAILALPLIVIAVTALAALGPSPATLILVIGIVFAPLVARTMRQAVRAERRLDYVAVAQLRGDTHAAVLFREILPNVLPPLRVEATIRLGYAIFTAASLSFLGFGLSPPSPDWGLTIAETYGLMPGGAWWPTICPAAATASLVIGVHLLAEHSRP